MYGGFGSSSLFRGRQTGTALFDSNPIQENNSGNNTNNDLPTVKPSEPAAPEAKLTPEEDREQREAHTFDKEKLWVIQTELPIVVKELRSISDNVLNLFTYTGGKTEKQASFLSKEEEARLEKELEENPDKHEFVQESHFLEFQQSTKDTQMESNLRIEGPMITESLLGIRYKGTLFRAQLTSIQPFQLSQIHNAHNLLEMFRSTLNQLEELMKKINYLPTADQLKSLLILITQCHDFVRRALEEIIFPTTHCFPKVQTTRALWNPALPPDLIVEHSVEEGIYIVFKVIVLNSLKNQKKKKEVQKVQGSLIGKTFTHGPKGSGEKVEVIDHIVLRRKNPTLQVAMGLLGGLSQECSGIRDKLVLFL